MDSLQNNTPATPSNRLNRLHAVSWRMYTLLERATKADLLAAAALFLVFFSAMAVVQFSTPDMPDNDGYYHIKLAALMRQEGLKPEFRWLPLTILNVREFYDHHFLFHVALIPFTFGDLRLGAKWAAVVFAALAFLSVWRLLHSQRIPYAWLWALGLLAVSEAFLYRMSITRAQSLSLAVLVLAVHWLLAEKYVRLLPLGFVYVWLYNAFPLLLGLSGIYVFARLLSEGKLDLRPVLYVSAGIMAGLLVNPYFPHHLVFIFHHLFPKLTQTTAISVGNEWFPYQTRQLLVNSFLSLAAFASGAFALGWSGKRMGLRTTFSFLLVLLFALMLFQSRRFIEYFPPFALIFSAFAWAPLFSKAYRSPLNLSVELFPMKKQPLHLSIPPGVQRAAPALVLALVLLPGVWTTLNAASRSIQGSKPYQQYSSASAWLAANTPAGALIFQTDWDDFPRLFFYNTHNTYLVGLDPSYMQIYDPALYDQWVEITQGRVKDPSGEILAKFGSEFVHTDLDHTNFIRQAEADPHLVERYRDEYAIIYQAAR